MAADLLTEVCNIFRRQGSKPIPKKKKCKQEKWLSEKVLQIAEKREVKDKGERDRYPTKCRVPNNIKERKESLKCTMQGNTEKQ